MSDLESILKRIERRLETLETKEIPRRVDLTDYLTETAANSLYLGKTATADNSARLGGSAPADFASAGHNHDSTYLGITAKAADSDKLDGVDSTGFVNTTDTQTINGAKTFGTLPTLPTTTPTANQAVRKGYADATYLRISAKAADSDKLDGKDSTDFVDKTTFDSGWTSYTPTFDGWTGTVNNVCEYKTIGKTCIVRINITSGTSDSTDGDISTATLPFKSRNVANLTWDGACGECADNGTILTTPCRWEVLPNSNIVSFYKDMNVGAWTKSGTKYQKAIIIYEIA
ncbi:MAG: hypothetical protein ACOYEB_12015 [Enterococcus lemanii]|jgi:hypothetical protein